MTTPRIRMATEDEQRELQIAWLAFMRLSEAEWSPCDIYIRENYITGGPGYVGSVALMHWDGDPTYITVATQNQGRWEFVNYGG